MGEVEEVSFEQLLELCHRISHEMLINLYDNSINKLLLHPGIPDVVYTGTSFTNSSSTQQPVSNFVPHIFALVSEKVDETKTKFDKIKIIDGKAEPFIPSKILASRVEMRSNSESDIHGFVKNVAADVLALMGYAHLYYVVRRDGIWVVRSSTDGLAMFIIKVMMSKNESILNDLKVLGQGFDYIVQLSASSSRRVLFCVLTTYEYWRIVWLPDTDAFAASNVLPAPFDEGNLLPPQIPTEVVNRELHGSKIYNKNDPELIPALMSALWKSVHSPFRPVKLIESRMYMRCDKEMYRYAQLPDSLLEPTLQYPNKTSVFYFIRDYHGGADGRVWLAGTEKGCLAVLKFHYDSEVKDKEKNLWKLLYDVTLFSATLYPGKDALVLPVAIHCQHVEVGGALEFNINIASWTNGTNVTPFSMMVNDTLDLQETPFIQDLPTPADALREACAKLTAKGKVHNDLEWRHLALLPRYEDGVYVRMEPILLDLAAVEDSTEENAEVFAQKMQHLLNGLQGV